MNKVRCAIYTRKSSEEGLEQDFNSLHAQREACHAYILSQASEGWSLLPEEYDDGGLSGGTLERPALQRLLADVEAGKIDIVVVYKVDRLTRSLLDFAKLIEAFDKAGTSFISITQSFNTTTSMGRLTLNMLLSFAQFEREVTAERIRDKIAASKAKGMWMGGNPPLGYRPDGRTLAIVAEHAALVRNIFDRYLQLGNVRLLTQQLESDGIRVPVRSASTGRPMGGGKFTRGQIYKILSNPIYVGEIHHQGRVYEGKHQAIVERELWDDVQAKLADNTQGSQRASSAKAPSLLASLVFDHDGEPLVASHACKGKVRYRYYVSRSLQRDGATDGVRVPARELEGAVIVRLAELLDNPIAIIARLGLPADRATISTVRSGAERIAQQLRKKDQHLIRSVVSRVDVHKSEVRIEVSASAVAEQLAIGLDGAIEPIVIHSAAKLTRTGIALRLVEANGKHAVPQEANPAMIELLLKARRWWSILSGGAIDAKTLARQENIDSSWLCRVVRLNFLAPELVTAILEGNQPAMLSAGTLTKSGPLPSSWAEQIKAFSAS